MTSDHHFYVEGGSIPLRIRYCPTSPAHKYTQTSVLTERVANAQDASIHFA
jgi:hypothetical protein